MCLTRFAAASSAALVIATSACVSRLRPATDVAAAQSSVHDFEAAWADAFNRHDTTAIARYLAPDFTTSTHHGEYFTRTRYVAAIAADTDHHTATTIDDEAVRLYGNVAVATFRSSRTDNGKPRVLRVTDVLRNVNGHWVSQTRHFSEWPGTASMANAPAGGSAAGGPALTDLVLGVDSAWNARNLDRFVAQFTPDVDFRLVGTSNDQGRDALRADYTRAFASLPASARHHGVVDDVIMLRPDVALADMHVFVETVNPDSSRTPLRTWAGTAVAVNGSDGWRIRAVRLQLVPRTP